MAKKLLAAAVNTLCAAAILVSLLAGWTAITTPKGKVPALFGLSMLTVLTGSMAPALPENSLILVRLTPPQQIKVGDVITFYTDIAGYNGVVNTHRVVGITAQDGAAAFRTRGDANALEDTSLVPADRLVGRVFFHSLALGIVVSFLRRPYVFFLVILIPLLAVAVRSLLQLVRLGKEEVRRAQEELEEARHDRKQ